MLSISRFVRPCMCVCLFVHRFTFEVPFKGIFASTSQSQMSKILEIQNSWKKLMERIGLTFETFIHKRCKITAKKEEEKIRRIQA